MSTDFTDILGRHWTAADTRIRDRVIDLTHYTTAPKMRDREWIGVRLLADGFGQLTPGADGFGAMIGDWSHVRDSSPEAFRAMHAYLTEKGFA